MENENSEIIVESSTIEKEKITLKRNWSFWESYITKEKSSTGYCDLLKEIYSFNDIISFWQFWNKYPGNDAKKIFYNGEYVTYFFEQKYRINALNVFVKGIRPEWEDEKNKKGKIFISEYQIDNNKSDLEKFLSAANEIWNKLLIFLIGEQLPYTENINGIRFVDKTKLGKGAIFKFEIWTNNKMSDKNDIEKLQKVLSNILQSGILVKTLE